MSFETSVTQVPAALKVAARSAAKPTFSQTPFKDITDAVMYLTDAATVTGDVLYVDGDAHFGHW
jgi:enoyl-[acyl-carrier-protein] reductase (NADH)